MEYICFTSSKGGVGTSRVVEQIALSLCAKGYKCLVVDLHTKRRTLDIYLSVSNEFVYDINDVSESICDFDDALVKVSDSLYFVSCSQIRDIENYTKIYNIIKSKSQKFDFVLLDVPYDKSAYDGFNKTIIVTTCDFASVRCAEKLCQDLQNDEKYLIINKIDVDLINCTKHINVDDICDLCGVKPIGFIPYDYEYFNYKNKNSTFCREVFDNIASRINNEYVSASDFKINKTKKLFSRR